MLEVSIQHGAQAGVFAVLPDDRKDVVLAALSVWSAICASATMRTVIDKIARAELAVDDSEFRLLSMVVGGLTTSRVRQSRGKATVK